MFTNLVCRVVTDAFGKSATTQNDNHGNDYAQEINGRVAAWAESRGIGVKVVKMHDAEDKDHSIINILALSQQRTTVVNNNNGIITME